MTSSPARKTPPPWQPTALLGQFIAMNLEQVRAAYEGTHFLIVRLDQFSSSLGAGLKAADAQSLPPRPRLDLAHLTISGSMVITKLTPPQPGQDLEVGRGLHLSQELLQAECHVVRIRKRTRSATPQVTVGRSPDQDIPLQHPSVSKLHALLEVDGDLYLTDVGSLNGTFVNGAHVQQRIKLNQGDAIKFGAVRCVPCTAPGLWHLLQHEPVVQE